MAGNLYIVATPIGNLGDLSQRAIETLRSVDVVLCEDTRVTQKLLNHFGLQKAVRSIHQHTQQDDLRTVLVEIEKGNSVAYVSDAGTPGISDPGGLLVSAAVKKGITIIPIPGPCAAIAALSISGFPTDRFRFFGFPPQKNGRKKFFEAVAETEETVVFYESKYRIQKTLSALPPERRMMLGRELTKMHETVYRGSCKEILPLLTEQSGKGEFVLVLAPKTYGQ
ncbi:MAG: 16S rRNA (cytidine(1402)-2'-O)-methyltransferase [Patescibacteria group bacterium]